MSKKFPNLSKMKLSYISKEFCAGLILFGLGLQMLPLTINAQKLPGVRQEKSVVKTVEDTDPQPNNKVAPDLEENVDQMLFEGRPDSTQKVIITLKEDKKTDEEKYDSGILIGNLTGQDEVNTKITGVGGRLKKNFSKMGMISADLPLSKSGNWRRMNSVAYTAPTGRSGQPAKTLIIIKPPAVWMVTRRLITLMRTVKVSELLFLTAELIRPIN